MGTRGKHLLFWIYNSIKNGSNQLQDRPRNQSTVFVVKDGEIKTATITGVLFTDFPYQYKLIDAGSNVLFRDEDNVFDTVENAIKDLVSRYTERLAARYDADLAKI